MDGLIEQAKSRLWNIVNTLTTLKFKGKSPQIEIALYEYGNNDIKNDNWVRQIVPFTTDLDLISGKLFALKTYGGDEYCGAVIKHALDRLDWGGNTSDMKLIYIAGNEPFNQGKISYKSSITEAVSHNIYVNTIHCGSNSEGIRGYWRDGAVLGQGKYFNIDHNARVQYVRTPYDDRISQYNEELNRTYIGYGADGRARKEYQVMQDRNAESISMSNKAERAVSKSKGVYNNKSWDLVDMVKENEISIQEIKEAELPEELQGKRKVEIEIIIKNKLKERESIQNEIKQLAVKRQEYIDAENKKSNSSDDDLGKAITESLLALAVQKGYEVEK